MILLSIAIIVIIIVYNDKITKLKNEIYHLKQKQGNGKNFCPKCGADLRNLHNNCPAPESLPKEIPKPVTNNYNLNNNTQTKQINIEKPTSKKYSDKEIKNNLILITGSVLLILSAILFLTTTWNITNNVLKSGVLFAMLLIFVATSIIADKYLKLSNTSKAFHYIALAYLPIVLLSLSLFGLIGEYFSISGDGRYIYITICSLFVTGVYYYFSNKNKEKVLGIISMIFSIISILFLGSCFTHIFTHLLLLLVIYLIILIFLYRNKVFYLYDKLHLYTMITLMIGLPFLSLNNSIFTIITGNVTYMEIIIDVLLLFSAYLLFVKVKDYKRLFAELYPPVIIYTFFNMIFLLDVFVYQQLLMILSFVIIFFIDIFEHKSIKVSSFFEVIFSSFVLILVTFIQRLFKTPIIPEFTLFLLITFFAFIFFYMYKKKHSFPAYIFAISIPISMLVLIIDQNWHIIVLEYLALLMIASSLFLNNDKRIQQSFKIIGTIVFNLFILFALDCSYWSLLLILLYIVINIFLFIKDKYGIYKVVCFIYLNIFLMDSLYLMGIHDIDAYLRVVSITSILLIAMDLLVKRIRDNTNEVYIVIQSIIGFLLLTSMKATYTTLIILILLTIIFMIYLSAIKVDKNISAIVLGFLIPHIYFREYLIFNNFNIMIIISSLFLLYFAYANYIKEEKKYMILYFLFAICHSMMYSPSKYITLFLLGIGILINYIISKEKLKDLFKVLLITIILILLEFIIYDLKLDDITCIKFLPYLIFVPILTRLTIKKYTNYYKIHEYIGYIMISLFAFFQYTSEFDGMLFVSLLTIVVIASYIIKLGPIFVVSLATILINVFLLTRTFWLSLPWWLYILVIGAILIGFAIYNELNEKKNDSLITKIRNKIDF